jgi:TPR repeat protein
MVRAGRHKRKLRAVSGRRRDGLGWVIAILAVAGIVAAGVTAWLSNANQSATVIAGLVAAAVAGAVTTQLQQTLGGVRERRAVLARRAAGVTGGRRPRLGDIDLSELGVRSPREASGQPRHQPSYASRHALDPVLTDAFTKHPFTLVQGPSAAGKSRSSAEAARRLWPSRPVLVPYQQQGALAELADAGVRPQTVVWLDDLDRHLKAGVDAGLVRRLLGVKDVRIIATMRASAFEAFKPGPLRPPGDDVIDLARPVRFTGWDQQDRDQATELLANETDVVAALRRGTGLSDYLSAVPDLIERLEQGAPPPQGVAVVRVVADWYRAGLARPVPVSWVRDLYPAYLPGDDVTLLSRFDDGVSWATTPVSGARVLTQPTDGSGLTIHDSVLEYISATLPPGLPEAAWRAVTAELATRQGLDEFTAVGVAAYRVHADPGRAESLLRQAAGAGLADAANNLGLLLQQTGRAQDAEPWFMQAAQAGNADAANNLGLLLQQTGRAQDAEPWFMQAAQAGNADAAANLGLLLLFSWRAKDAEPWLRQAAEAGSADAANNLGLLLEQSGRSQDAGPWYKQAAEAGDADAANNLGLLLQQTGHAQDAEPWFRQAAQAGHPDAADNLGLLRRQSRRVERFRASLALGQVNRRLRRRMDAGDIPGVVAGIERLAQDADLILAEDYGLREVMHNIAQASDLIARSGSVSQLSAAVAAFEKAADGRSSPLLRATFQALRGALLVAKLGKTEEMADLEAATAAFQEAVDTSPRSNPVRAVYQDRLARLQAARSALAGLAPGEEPRE